MSVQPMDQQTSLQTTPQTTEQPQFDLFSQQAASSDEMGLQERFDFWVEKGAIRALDLAFVRFIDQTLIEKTGQGLASEQLWLALILASERTGHGHVCLDLSTLAPEATKQSSVLLSPVRNEEAAAKIQHQLAQMLSGVSLPDLVAELKRCPAVAFIADAPSQDASNGTPLVLSGTPDQPLLYLRRYWQYEQDVIQGISQRLRFSDLSEKALPLLQSIFGDGQDELSPNWQKIACALSARSGFSIITGGPGTGKTTTVVRLLALLQGLELAEDQPPLVIRLAAPTGKAAARLNESIAGSVERLNLKSDQLAPEQSELWQSSIPTEVSTLHRLLGSQPNTRHFRHNRGNPLPADIVVVDEASMVDVEMMAKLMDALRPDARLILLGDKDQLASVEAGSVLGDLCQQAEAGLYWPETCKLVQSSTGQQITVDYQASESAQPTLTELIAQATTMLRHCYRAEGEGILDLADWVNKQGVQAVDGSALSDFFQRFPSTLSQISIAPKDEAVAEKAVLQQESSQKAYFSADERNWSDFNRLIVEGYSPYLKMLSQQPTDAAALEAWVLELFEQHKQFQLLAAVRQGDYGIEGLNIRIRQLLAGRKLIQPGEHQWYAGRPVLVTQNDYSLKLMNGDIGICLSVPQEGADEIGMRHFRVAFPDGKGGIRWVLPSRLQSVETVFAMTVHKSQGSEFAHTAMILPDKMNAVLTKELLYTGITRSKRKFTLVTADPFVLQQALKQKVIRASGFINQNKIKY